MEYTETRIARTNAPSESVIAINLFDELESDKIVNIYFKRWKVEESYNVLKNKLNFDSVTGEATIYVYQDF